MSTTSGSSRSATRSASANECVSVFTSRWFTMQLLCVCKNSIGSSMVIMFSRRSPFLFKTMLLHVRHHAVGEPLGIRSAYQLIAQRAQLPVHTRLRRNSDSEVQVGGA